ncbi:MAG: iron (metal) dependent repressor, DtxR family [Clostridiaceae bacterium]|jgi:Mn-dependent DtxR family transcriptional regulator|nr:iron (metal) dependent repressor, DtxR family [Clostridiaceae bacterium]
MNINESVENYLETILILSKNLPMVRSIDVATELNFKKSSVSVAMKNLREKEYITMTNEGYILLTETGKKISTMVYEKHTFLSGWLKCLGVDANTATEDACRIEHVISNESFEAIKKYVTKNTPNTNL